MIDARIDLVADLNDEDDEGLGWSTLSEASDPTCVRPGVMLVAGNRQAQAVVRWWPSMATGKCTSSCCPSPWRKIVTLSAVP